MEPDERRAVAKAAAAARWGGVAVNATHTGELEIAGQTISCAVLEDGRRVLTQETFLRALGRSRKGKGGQAVTSPDGLPPFLAAEALKDLITDDLRKATAPIVFRSPSGNRAYGYEATLLPMVCEVYLQARDQNKTTKQQERIVRACDMLMRGLAQVGIIALVDEATGHQYDRDRRALTEILEKFIAKELVKWSKMFPDDFYKELYRLKAWKQKKETTKRPGVVGTLTINLVYQRLAPGVLDELKRLTPRDAKGRLKHKYFQRLTEDVGHPKLKEHFLKLLTLMEASETWDEFYRLVEKALPKFKPMPLFDRLERPGGPLALTDDDNGDGDEVSEMIDGTATETSPTATEPVS